jgi:hypothetical protein
VNEKRKHKRSSATRRQFIGIAAGIATAGTLTFSALAFGSEEDKVKQCRTYASKNSLENRKEIIAKILKILSLSDPAAVAAWVTGSGKAPALIKEEMDLQVNCLAEAAAVSTGSGGSDPKISWRRDAATQRRIWDRKYDFLRQDEGVPEPSESLRTRVGNDSGTSWEMPRSGIRTMTSIANAGSA